MGIPRFQSWIRSRYPQLIIRDLAASLQGEEFHVSEFHIDLNAVIHPIAQRVAKYGREGNLESNISRREELEAMGQEAVYNLIYQAVDFYIVYAYRKVRPIRIFHVAVDGVAPVAKMMQQRFRRIKSSPELSYFDPSSISPGTPFMDGLHAYLQEVTFPKLQKEFPPGLRVFYSSHREPGEGEHKIMELLRMNPKTKQLDAEGIPVTVIQSADSDLIMLAFSYSKRIIFMRDDYDESAKQGADILEQVIDLTFKEECSDLDIEMIHAEWPRVFDQYFVYIDTLEIQRNIRAKSIMGNAIDFTIMAIMVGNDFLPAVPELSVVLTSIKTYFSSDEEIQRYYKKSYRVADKKFDERRFNDDYQKSVETWKRPFYSATGLLNPAFGRHEIFPLEENPLVGSPKRYLMYQDVARGSWEPAPGEIRTDEVVVRETDKKDRKIRMKTWTNKDGERISLKQIQGKRGWNNFLENWKEQSVSIGSLNHMMELYRVLRKQRKATTEMFVVTGADINYPNFLVFLEEIMGQITKFIDLKQNEYGVNVMRSANSRDVVPDASFAAAMEGGFSVARYRQLYYRNAFAMYDSEFGDVKLPKKPINEMCRNWFEGLQWVAKYYNIGHRSVNKEWFYRFYYAPSVFDLHDFLMERMIGSPNETYPGIFIPRGEFSIGGIEQYTVANGQISVYLGTSGKYEMIYSTIEGRREQLDPERILLVNRPFPEDHPQYPDQDVIVYAKKSITTTRINWEFLERREIMAVVSADTEYPTVTEMYFMIFPIRIIVDIFPFEDTELIISLIQDLFPDKYVSDTNDQSYKDQRPPHIPFPSLTRIREALQAADDRRFYGVMENLDAITPRFELYYYKRTGIDWKAIKME